MIRQAMLSAALLLALATGALSTPPPPSLAAAATVGVCPDGTPKNGWSAPPFLPGCAPAPRAYHRPAGSTEWEALSVLPGGVLRRMVYAGPPAWPPTPPPVQLPAAPTRAAATPAPGPDVPPPPPLQPVWGGDP